MAARSSPCDYYGYVDEYYSQSQQFGVPHSSYYPYNYSYSADSSQLVYFQPQSYQQTHYFQSAPSSYSVSVFDETDFKEYDPTPYSGGYDQQTTYGSPLPPSDSICYPRTKAQPPSDAIPPVPEDLSHDSIPSPCGSKQDNNDSQIESPSVDEEKQGNLRNGDGLLWGDSGYYFYGSGLESVDLCESLFGYWPCLNKRSRENEESGQVQRAYEEDRHPWDLCADYLFGTATTSFDYKKEPPFSYQ